MMLASMRMSADKFSLEDQAQPIAAGFLYRLTLAFPSWAGAILAVYSIFLSRFSALRVRLKWAGSSEINDKGIMLNGGHCVERVPAR
jgi:hypothetical protein